MKSWAYARNCRTRAACISRNTLTSLEFGRPGVAIGVCFTVLCALGLDVSLIAKATLVGEPGSLPTGGTGESAGVGEVS